MKANHDNCHLLMSSAFTPISIKVKDYVIENSDCEKLLVVTVDGNLNFNYHLENVPKKVSKKVHVLARIIPYMSIPYMSIPGFLLHNLIIAYLLGCTIFLL